ncbi:MAG: Na(+)-translocating NADH-quinone reductase subunit C [Anaerobiospirillum succiniciproducens]|uniref:Na(+)-translocating NADH-quinone reductase subunit C n=1 Tax=Anaerobiospirillum succiniciproducens TaxID=13335 RepID=UPI002357B773|nr:Na(+)-translocating NADH-quinone reductase subunit C [Anaerobiospirillum succiniciproducens]MCI6864122.1 Na(+)-translocating NADH-quinone reductase subunit C [Anaerobiospirillum succiniciproducens]MDY2798711.1 Na(+)-translocating NADH-quinone reductase subunit C [Anaerobiospirillum succiniciproducens]
MLKLNKDSVFGTFVVIIAFCLVCSVVVSSAVVALGPFQQAAIANDRQINILRVSGFEVEGSVAKTYAKHIEARLVDLETGKYVEDSAIAPSDFNFQSLAKNPDFNVAIPAEEDVANIRTRTKLMPIYLSKDENGNTVRYILPFYGMALWSTVYGYVALDPDGNTIKAITFYSHGETPGLGGEIDNPRWQALWIDKKLTREDGSRGFNITKTPDHNGEGKDYDVDSLSGATLTARGVDNAANYWFENAYKAFLENLRKGEM